MYWCCIAVSHSFAADPLVSGSEDIMEVTGKDPPKTVLNHRCQIHGGRAAYESDESLKAEAECRFSCRVTAFGLQSKWRAGPTIRASEKAAAEDWLELYGDLYPPNPPIANDGRPVCKGDPGCAVKSWEHWVNKWHSSLHRQMPSLLRRCSPPCSRFLKAHLLTVFAMIAMSE